MSDVFEVADKSGRKIKLANKQWSHIRQEHPLVEEEEIRQTLISPLKIIQKSEDKYFYYQYFKYKDLPYRHLRVIVKYINGEGFVISAYFVRHIG